MIHPESKDFSRGAGNRQPLDLIQGNPTGFFRSGRRAYPDGVWSPALWDNLCQKTIQDNTIPSDLVTNARKVADYSETQRPHARNDFGDGIVVQSRRRWNVSRVLGQDEPGKVPKTSPTATRGMTDHPDALISFNQERNFV